MTVRRHGSKVKAPPDFRVVRYSIFGVVRRSSTPPMFRQVTILGPGLLGASLALALRERDLAHRVVAWSRRPETRANCRRQTWCDGVAESAVRAVEGSDLIVLCTPVDIIPKLLREVGPVVAPGALLTDVGSTKSLICRSAAASLPQCATFVGAHPMAGSEQAGMDHARADLFVGAACIVTPLAESDAASVDRVTAFWESLGALVTHCSPERHDEIVAHISHLPHLLASCLCAYLGERDAAWGKLAGGGLRDSTRIAAGDPTLWRQILEQNREEVLRSIEGFEDQLQQIKAALHNHDSLELFARLKRGKTYRDQLPPGGE